MQFSTLTNDQLIEQLNQAAAKGWGNAFRAANNEIARRKLSGIRVQVGNAATGTSPYDEDNYEDVDSGPRG